MATAAETKHVRIRRNPRGFGFTLRYYVDEGGADMGPKYSNDGRNAQLYEQHRDAIVFIKNVLSRGPADVAGLNVGDRVQGINGVSVRGKSYHEIVKVVQDSPEELDLLVVPQAVHSESFEGAGLKLKAVTAKPLFHQHQLTVEPSPLSPNAPRNRSFTTENWGGFGVDQQQHPGSDTIGTRTMSANATMIRPIRLHHVIKFDNDTEEEEEESKSSSAAAGAGQPLSPPPSLEERKPGDGGEASPPQKQSPRRQRGDDYVTTSGNPKTERRQNLKGLGLTATPYYHAGVAAAQSTELESPAVLFDDDDEDEEVEEAERPAFSRFRKAAPIVRMRSEKSAYKRGESPGQRKSSVEFRRSATVGAWERKGSVSEPTSPAGTKDVTLLKNLLGRVELSDGDDTGGTNTTNSPAVDQGYYSSRKFQFEGLVSVGSSGAGGASASGGTREPEWKPTRHSYGSSPHPYMEAVEKSGYLRQKQTIDSNGKKAKDRSWRLHFYQLRGHMLYAFKDEKDAKAGDVAPLSIKSCRIDIAHDYQKKPNTFRLTLFNGSEFLLNTDTQDSMLNWIKAIRDNSDPDGDKQNAGRSDLIMRKAAQQEQKLADKGARNLTAKIKKKQDSLRAARRTNSLRVPRRNTSGKDGSESGSTTPTAFRRGGGSFFRRKGAGGGGHSPNLHHHDHFEEFDDGDHFFRKTLSECELSLQHDNVPLLIVRCATEIEKRGLEVEGIYRIPGKKSEIRLLAEEFRRDVYNASFEDQRWGDIHSITSLLKLFLRDLTEPIFPTDMYDNFMSVSKIQDDDQRLIMLKQLIQQLSTLHYATLRYIIQHLHKVASRADFNKMYPRNLAIVFGPTLVRRHYDSMQHLVSQMGDQCKIVESLVTHCTWFFASVPEEGGKRSGIFLRPSQSGDWSILPEILDAAAFQNSSSSSKAKAPRKPRRTWEFDPTDPDTGTESSDFWVRYPPTIDHSDFSQSSSSQAAAAAAAVAASSLASSRADSTRQWISQMSASAWQTESSASPPSSRQSRHRGSVSGIASGGTGEPVVRRQRRGRQNQWRDVTVTGSGDFSDGRLAVFRSREGEGASASAAGGKGGKDSPQTTLL